MKMPSSSIRCAALHQSLIVLSLLVSLTTLHAQGPDKNTGKDYVLLHKSAYTASTSVRNPFWPIGWVPTAAAPTQEAAIIPTVGPEMFSVSSISLDFPPLAVINKRTYGVGDRIPVSTGATSGPGEYVTVRQIVDGTITLDHRGRLFRVSPASQPMGTKK